MRQLFIKILSKCISLLESIGSKKNAQKTNENILIGPNCSIDSSAALNTGQNGSIVLEGNNFLGQSVLIDVLSKIEIGFNTSIQDRCRIIGDVNIGRHCLFAPNVFISSGNHYFDLYPFHYIKDQDTIVSQSEELSSKHSKKVTIEDDCWIGTNVVVMQGITIAKGSVVGANSVVTKDVAPYSVMAGIPAKKIKDRILFEAKTTLLFDRDEDLPYFYSGFYTDLASLSNDRKNGGIKAMQKFKFYADGLGKTSLLLTVKKSSFENIKVQYNNQIFEISSDDYQEFKFEISQNLFHSFEVISASNDFSIYIKSVSIV